MCGIIAEPSTVIFKHSWPSLSPTTMSMSELAGHELVSNNLKASLNVDSSQFYVEKRRSDPVLRYRKTVPGVWSITPAFTRIEQHFSKDDQTRSMGKPFHKSNMKSRFSRVTDGPDWLGRSQAPQALSQPFVTSPISIGVRECCNQASIRPSSSKWAAVPHPNEYPIFPILPGSIGPPIAPAGMVGNSVLEKSKPAAQS